MYEGEDFECFLVADGLGGQGYGEVASGIAASTAKEMTSHTVWSDIFFSHYFKQANQRIIDEQRTNSAHAQMMTTATMACIRQNDLYVAHSGDSRCYLFRHKRVVFRTIDHSVTQYLALSGQIKEKEIRFHPDRSKLLKAIGQRENSDFFEIDRKMRIRRGDALLLCTDGFWELINEKEMCQCLKKSCGAREWLDLMEKTVLKNGLNRSMDNYSAIALQIP